MTQDAIRQLAEEFRLRYVGACRAEKKTLLTEFCVLTHYHRKAAIRILNRRGAAGTAKGQRGRPSVYHDGALVTTLLQLWEASGFVCSKYLPAALPALIERRERCGGLALTDELRHRLLMLSGSTAERVLKPHRDHLVHLPHITARNPSDLSHRIAVHTFLDLRALPVGHLETDLVLHCGTTTEGFYLTTLVAVDVASSWTVCIPVWGKGKTRVGGAVARLQRELPFPLLAIHSDNGVEFINEALYDYCQRYQIRFSHSRPYHKNDQPRVEQRNGSLVRRIIGYGRYTSHVAQAQMDVVYRLACTHANFFRPTMKLIGRERRGARIIKHYDQPQTPYQRLLASGQLTSEQEDALRRQYETLDPLALQRALQEAVSALWKLDTPDPKSQRAIRLRQALLQAQAG